MQPGIVALANPGWAAIKKAHGNISIANALA